MTRDDAIMLLNTGVAVWNERRLSPGDFCFNLDGAILRGRDLSNANLSGVSLHNADLRRARLRNANLAGAELSHANLQKADLGDASLDRAYLPGADLWDADLRGATLTGATLTCANLAGADLTDDDLSGANLIGALLIGARLRGTRFEGTLLANANLDRAELAGADLAGATVNGTIFANIDLSVVNGLEWVTVQGPCTVGLDTMVASRGQIPSGFLRRCGLLPWQIELARLFDPALDPVRLSEVQGRICELRKTQFPWAGGIFISYSHRDRAVVDKLRDWLLSEGFPVWLDRCSLTAGPLQDQIDRAIRAHDVVLLVLSEASIDSDWVEHELRAARRREKAESRNILCPIALDKSWMSKVQGERNLGAHPDVNWEHLSGKNVLDFSGWQEEATFAEALERLTQGLKSWYFPGLQAAS